jgi:hypothetical protein
MMQKYGQGFWDLVAASSEPVDIAVVMMKWMVVFMS